MSHRAFTCALKALDSCSLAHSVLSRFRTQNRGAPWGENRREFTGGRSLPHHGRRPWRRLCCGLFDTSTKTPKRNASARIDQRITYADK
eukprot:3009685-Alexandrium_andersonii.AAC.1